MTNKHPINVQDGFLYQHLKAGRAVAVELANGGSLQGRIKRFDRYAIVLQNEERETLLYKHAVATVRELDE